MMTDRILTACAVLVATLSLSLPVAAESPYETEEPVDFSMALLDGGTLSLSSLRGQWVVMNYWATWCRPCREEMPELSELHEQRADVTVLGLAYEEAEPGDFKDFLEEFHATYPIVLVDVYAPPEPFGAPRVLPTTIILDPEGRAVKGFAGPVTRAQLESFIGERVAP
jgi:thiol-disulfide isomerase/thioredoxin